VIPTRTIAPGYSISRLIKGGWHLAGGHGAIDPAEARRDMARFVEAGITTFDCADIYTGVEALIGDFRREYPSLAKGLRVHTKFVPDLDRLAVADGTYVESIIDRSLARLGLERLDLVQFHWWDYAVPRYVDIALELERQRRKGKIEHIGVTNFDVAHLSEIVAAGVPVLAHQLQYSLLDARPAGAMAHYCASQGIALLCYGTVAGGFLSERWLGAAEPVEPLANRSLVKYKLILEDFGGWARFQALLSVLADIAHRHGSDIASVATASVLERPVVAAAIVGATSAAHLASHARLGDLVLDDTDRAAITTAVAGQAGPVGDVYTLERDRDGRHGRIMKYHLNR
jgi:aryl-alcohol dehydrogenase-like predicted oxidoreductase